MSPNLALNAHLKIFPMEFANSQQHNSQLYTPPHKPCQLTNSDILHNNFFLPMNADFTQSSQILIENIKFMFKLKEKRGMKSEKKKAQRLQIAHNPLRLCASAPLRALREVFFLHNFN